MKKKFKYGIGICLLFIFIVLYSFIDKKYPIYNQDIPAEEYVLCAMLEENTSISQTFHAEGESMKAVSLKCAVSGVEEKGELRYIVYDDNGRDVRKGVIPIAKLKSEKYNDFEFDTIENCQGREFTFEVCGKDIGECNVSFYKTIDKMDETLLRRDQEIEEGTLVLKSVTYTFDWETLIVVSCFTVYIIIFIRMLYKFFR